MSHYVQQGSFTCLNSIDYSGCFGVGRLNGWKCHSNRKQWLSKFTQVGRPSTVPSFMRVSPNGTQVALGDGNQSSCSTQAPNTYKTFEASNFDGEWVNDAKLAISSVGHVDQGTGEGFRRW